MTRFIITLALLFGMNAVQAQTWKNFTDTAGNFTARYPDTWVNKIKDGNRVFFTSPQENDGDEFKQNVNISVTYAEELKGTPIRTLIPELMKAQEGQYQGYKFIGGKYFTWNGIESYEYDYSIKQEGLAFDVRITQWMSIKNGKIYMVTYTAPVGPDTMRNTALKIMKSIVF